MKTHVEFWAAATKSLGVEIAGPIDITIKPGLVISVDMHVKGFGGSKGTIVCTNYSNFWDHREIVVAEGYGYSSFGAEGNGQGSTEDLIDLLSDWGWSGTGDPPDWLKQPSGKDKD